MKDLLEENLIAQAQGNNSQDFLSNNTIFFFNFLRHNCGYRVLCSVFLSSNGFELYITTESNFRLSPIYDGFT